MKRITPDDTDRPFETAGQRVEMCLQMDKGKALATIENLMTLLTSHSIICQYNVISKRIEISIPGEGFSEDNEDSAALARILSRLRESKIPSDGYCEYLAYIGEKNAYNPALEWIKNAPWDGKDHIADLCSTITAEHEESKNLFLRRWLITAAAMAALYDVDAAGCLVLQGSQGIGKTWWIRKLAPTDTRLIRTGATINPRDRDSLSQLIRYWIAELGEIGSTFKRADIDSLKAFITDSRDILRRPFGRADQVYPRRTALIASVNERIYLHDETGNRRFWTIACKSVDSYHNVDMQQVWAQALALLDSGETWQMSAEEKKWVHFINNSHLQIDPITEMVMAKYEWGQNYFCEEWKTATQIAKELELKIITQRETRSIASLIRKLNSNDATRERISDGYPKFLMKIKV